VSEPQPQVAHIGIAVDDIDDAARFYREVLGLQPCTPETVDGARIVSFTVGGVNVELLQPESPDSPIGRFLARRGPGIHHVCYRVADLGRALEACRSAGFQLIDEEPRSGAGSRRIAFVHPKATAGTLIELTE
jgi:methylmalonyl-CoA/ethylmalonyl-CoA epimerase